MSSIIAISILCKNEIIFYKCFIETSRELMESIIFASLDVIDITPSSGYLGNFFSIDQYCTFGLISNTDIKVILICDEYAIPSEITSYQELLQKTHNLFIKHYLNPFQLNAKLTNDSFSKSCEHLIIDFYGNSNKSA